MKVKFNLLKFCTIQLLAITIAFFPSTPILQANISTKMNTVLEVKELAKSNSFEYIPFVLEMLGKDLTRGEALELISKVLILR